MRSVFLFFFLSAVLLLGFALKNTERIAFSVPAPKAPLVVKGSDGAAHHIRFLTDFDGDVCSSTAVGKHTLLTAGHCVIGTGFIEIDGHKTAIKSTAYDEKDHVLLVVDANFRAYAEIEERSPYKGEHVRMWGWPGSAKQRVFREGVFQYVDRGFNVYGLPAFPGDSGSALYTDDGKVLAVVSTANTSAQLGTLPLAFTPAQLKHIQ